MFFTFNFSAHWSFILFYFIQERDLNNLKDLLNKNDVREVKNLLEKILQSYNSNSEIVDNIYVEQKLSNNKT